MKNYARQVNGQVLYLCPMTNAPFNSGVLAFGVFGAILVEIPVVGQFDLVAAIPQGGIAKWRRPDKIGTGSAASTSN
jgi:hypothetical protein